MVPAATVSVLGLNMKLPLLFVVMVTVVLEARVGVGVGLSVGDGVGVGEGVAVGVDPVNVGEELPMTVVGELTAVVGVTPGFGLFVMPSQAVTSSSDANNRR